LAIDTRLRHLAAHHGSQRGITPLAALFGILAGGEIAGILGVYLSIP